MLVAVACSPASSPAIVMNNSPQEAQRVIDGATNTSIAQATQYAQATLHRAETEQAVSDAQTQTLMPLVIQSTEQALNLLSDGATSVAEQTATAQTLQQRVAESREWQETVWTLLKIGGTLAIIICTCLLLLSIGYAVSARTLPDTFQIVEINGVPVAYRWLVPHTGTWVVRPIDTSRYIEAPRVVDAQYEERELRAQYCQVLKKLAQASAIYETWSIDVLSNRDKVRGVASEGTVYDLRVIGEHLGQLQDYGGSRGWDYAPQCNYTTLSTLLADPDTLTFPLPQRADGTYKPAPIVGDPKPNQAKPSEPRQILEPLAVKSSGRKRAKNA